MKFPCIAFTVSYYILPSLSAITVVQKEGIVTVMADTEISPTFSIPLYLLYAYSSLLRLIYVLY